MLNFLLSLKSLSLVILPLAFLATVDRGAESTRETRIAARYHLRQHAAAASSRPGNRSIRSNSNSYRQHYDHVTPGTHPGHRPQQMIAIKPSVGVRS